MKKFITNSIASIFSQSKEEPKTTTVFKTKKNQEEIEKQTSLEQLKQLALLPFPQYEMDKELKNFCKNLSLLTEEELEYKLSTLQKEIKTLKNKGENRELIISSYEQFKKACLDPEGCMHELYRLMKKIELIESEPDRRTRAWMTKCVKFDPLKDFLLVTSYLKKDDFKALKKTANYVGGNGNYFFQMFDKLHENGAPSLSFYKLTKELNHLSNVPYKVPSYQEENGEENTDIKFIYGPRN